MLDCLQKTHGLDETRPPSPDAHGLPTGDHMRSEKSHFIPAAKRRSSPATFRNRKTNTRGRARSWLDYPDLFHITF
jgi:hypothetical protein